jgi:hypothetical protein
MVEQGRGALLTQVGDVSAMSQHIVELAGDRERRTRMGVGNRERFVDLYHPDRVGERAVQTYLRAASLALAAGA